MDEMDGTCSMQGGCQKCRPVAESCEYCNECLGFIKVMVFFEQVSDCQLF
jgi:hypothetical protein